jgi:hypothetical protein
MTVREEGGPQVGGDPPLAEAVPILGELLAMGPVLRSGGVVAATRDQRQVGLLPPEQREHLGGTSAPALRHGGAAGASKSTHMARWRMASRDPQILDL